MKKKYDDLVWQKQKLEDKLNAFELAEMKTRKTRLEKDNLKRLETESMRVCILCTSESFIKFVLNVANRVHFINPFVYTSATILFLFEYYSVAPTGKRL